MFVSGSFKGVVTLLSLSRKVGACSDHPDREVLGREERRTRGRSEFQGRKTHTKDRRSQDDYSWVTPPGRGVQHEGRRQVIQRAISRGFGGPTSPTYRVSEGDSRYGSEALR